MLPNSIRKGWSRVFVSIEATGRFEQLRCQCWLSLISSFANTTAYCSKMLSLCRSLSGDFLNKHGPSTRDRTPTWLGPATLCFYSQPLCFGMVHLELLVVGSGFPRRPWEHTRPWFFLDHWWMFVLNQCELEKLVGCWMNFKFFF